MDERGEDKKTVSFADKMESESHQFEYYPVQGGEIVFIIQK